MAPSRWLSLFLAWTLLLQSLAPALATPPSPPTEHTNRIGMDRQTLGTVGMGYGVTGVEHHQHLVDTSQPYAEVIQEAEWVNNALPLITRYDIGLDRLRMFKYQVTSNGPPPVYSPVLSGWYLFDGLGSTRALVDDSGAGTDLWGYQDAFGIPYRLYPAAGGTANTFFLNGQQWDGSGVWNSGEGLYFNRARYYQPGLGRFIGEDPEFGYRSDPRSIHRYLYTANDSVNLVDPSGREFSIAGQMAVSGVLGGLSGALHSYAVTGKVNIQETLLGVGIGILAPLGSTTAISWISSGTLAGQIAGGAGLTAAIGWGAYGLGKSTIDDLKILFNSNISMSRRGAAAANIILNTITFLAAKKALQKSPESPVHADIGVEGRYKDAIIVNPMDSEGMAGVGVPEYIQGNAENTSLPSNSVDIITYENCPVGPGFF